MESHRLVQEGGPRDAEWVLAWDDATLTLDAPDGQRMLEAPPSAAHRIVGLYELYSEGKVSFATPHGPLAFKKRSAVAAVRGLVEAGLAGDPGYCADLRRQSLRAIPCGLVMFVVAGGLFGLYCWWAFTAGDPPPGTWLRWVLVRFGWAIHWVLLILISVALAGPLVNYSGLRQWWRFRRIGRAATGQQRHAQPGAAADGGA